MRLIAAQPAFAFASANSHAPPSAPCPPRAPASRHPHISFLRNEEKLKLHELSSWRSSWYRALYVLLLVDAAAANVGNQRPTYAHTTSYDGRISEVVPAAHPPAAGCDGALNNC